MRDESENRMAALPVQVNRVWHQGKVLRVTFRDDESGFSPEEYEEVKSAIIDYANIWTHHANISFSFTDDQFSAGSVRIAFIPGKGHNSYIGTNCVTILGFTSVPTMNFDPK